MGFSYFSYFPVINLTHQSFIFSSLDLDDGGAEHFAETVRQIKKEYVVVFF